MRYARTMRGLLVVAFLGGCGFSAPLAPSDGPPIDMPPEASIPVTWSVDSLSKKPVPANAQEWADFIKAKNLTITVPDGLWLMQEFSGPLADSIGTVTLAPFGTSSYRLPIDDWSRRAVGTADNANAGFFNNTSPSLPDMSTSSLTILMLFVLPTTPPTARSILVGGANAPAAYGRMDVDSSKRFHSVVGGIDTAGTANLGTAAVPVIFKLDHGNMQQKLITSAETISAGFVPLQSSRGLFIGGAGFTAPDVRFMYLAAWYGTKAQFSDAQSAALLAALQW